MEPLKTRFHLDPLNHFLIRIGDLINIDGPILALFEDVRNGHLYLFDWVDRDNRYNRWIIFRVTARQLFNFISKTSPYNELFNSPVNEKYYFSDIGSNSFFPNNVISLLDDVPEKYQPNKNDFFDKSDCPHYDKMIAFIIRNFETQKKDNTFLTKGIVLPSKHKTIKFDKIGNNFVSSKNWSSYPHVTTLPIGFQDTNNIRPFNNSNTILKHKKNACNTKGIL